MSQHLSGLLYSAVFRGWFPLFQLSPNIESRPPFAEQGLSRLPVCLGQKGPTSSIQKLPYGSLHNSKIIKYCIMVVDISSSSSLGSAYFCFLFIHMWRIKGKAVDVHKFWGMQEVFLMYCSVWTARKLLRSKPQPLLVMHFLCLACVFKS